ncbi:MarR family winged helix-turn-helix transcriptional regulator [Streptomyces sp. NBC_00690]|uniref:MarR family winged helix-turn-helix transcriptional regulator n=1 Tax=Streptomyces sp. NBC_00690 TaxID=2975808 RepID=UPI002E29DA3E|nr:MarR family winged helix-turn-helix transcriptional regulator [Streptomyces sp. NBC_00690]
MAPPPPPASGRPSGSGIHDDLHWLFARIKQGLATAATAAVREHGMSHWGYTVLIAVAESPARSQLTLARAVSVDKSKLVLVLDELETAGLVRRRPDPSDRRARIVEATQQGHRTLNAARRDVEAIESELLADLDAPARTALRTVLQRLAGEPVERIEGGRPTGHSCAPPGA